MPAVSTTNHDVAFAAWLSAQRPFLDAPCTIRVLGAAGTGAADVAAALDQFPQWSAHAVDSDSPLPPCPPDIEVLCLCTAPCTHEAEWLARARRHPMLVIITRTSRWTQETVPPWATDRIHLAGPPWPSGGLVAETGFAHMCTLLDHAHARMEHVRTAVLLARLERDCDTGDFRGHAEALAAELSPLLSAGSPSAPSSKDA